MLKTFLKEYPLFVSIFTLLLLGYYEHDISATILGNILGFLILFAVIIYSSVSVAHHAEVLAVKFGEPYGTLILTMSAVIVEILIISIMMLHDGNATLARDTIYSAMMLDINGLLGFAAIVGGIKHGEQPYNVDSSNSYMGMLLVATGTAMIIPHFISQSHHDAYMLFVVIIFILLYVVFTRVQLKDHRYFFEYKADNEECETCEHDSSINATYHVVMLIVSIVMIGFLSEILSVFMSNTVEHVGLPLALVAVGVAVISAAPELITAVRAAINNRMQTVINIALGASLATVLLTVPAVIIIGRIVGMEIELALTPIQGVMVGLTILVSIINFSDGETNMLEGFLHVVLFTLFSYLIFIT